MISVIIPLYNQADKLPLCLNSLLAQTFTDFEIIIVNDSSTDKSAEVAASWQDRWGSRRFLLIDQSQKGNASIARNRGFREARGDYLLFCDADIVMRPDMLAKMSQALQDNPTVAFVYSSFYYGWKKFALRAYDRSILRQQNFITTTSLLRRAVFPGFDESLTKFQDWDLWLTLAERNCVGYFISEYLFTMLSGGAMSQWLPSFVYRLCPWLPTVKKYQTAKAIIRAKHGLDK